MLAKPLSDTQAPPLALPKFEVRKVYSNPNKASSIGIQYKLGLLKAGFNKSLHDRMSNLAPLGNEIIQLMRIGNIPRSAPLPLS